MTGIDSSHPFKRPAQRANMVGVRRASRFEQSAGGVARDGNNLLMIRVETLEGKEVWTFPKGHIEAGESAEQAAVREVSEETGYRCEITDKLETIRYWFQRDGILTQKTVVWFLMRSLGKSAEPDPEEVLEAAWVPLEEAALRVRYKSDRKIMSLLKAQSPS